MSTVVEEEKAPLLGTLGVVKGKKALKEPKPVARPQRKVKELKTDQVMSDEDRAYAEFWEVFKTPLTTSHGVIGECDMSEKKAIEETLRGR